MKLKKINKILKDKTTSKRLKKEIHFLFEKLEMVSFHRAILQNNKPVESTEKLFTAHNKGGEIIVLKALKTMSNITKGDLYYATQRGIYYIFNDNNRTQTEVIKGSDIFEALEPTTQEPVKHPIAYEFHNTHTGHSYVDYAQRKGMTEKEGYTKIPLYTI